MLFRSIAHGRREKLSVDLEKVPMPITSCACVSNRQPLLWVEKISKTIINEIRSKFIDNTKSANRRKP